MKLRYDNQAKMWKQALPIGNGKLAAMIYGGKIREHIAVNDATLWSGYPRDHTSENSARSLSKARELVFSEKYSDADEFVKNNMCGEYCQSYLPLGDVYIHTGLNKARHYERTLDIDNAIINIESGNDRRETFVSYPDKALFYKFSFASKRNLTITASSKLRFGRKTQDGILFIEGYAPDNVIPNYVMGELHPIRYNENKAMGFAMGIAVQSDGNVRVENGKIKVIGAREAIVKIATETGFVGYDKMPSRDLEMIKANIRDVLDKKINFEEIKKRHIEDFNSIYGKHKLSLCEQKEADVEYLLKQAKRGNVDVKLVNVLYDYGKYLIAQGSRSCQPLNLQGQWNHSVRPPWSSNLTTNINFQMNYWAASSCNLSECITPMRNAAAEICESGKKTASVNYNCSGSACNHNVDIWRMTTPVKGNPAYMYAPFCGMWISSELCRHDIISEGKLSQSSLDIAEESAKFALDYLVMYNGKLVTCPSASPEAEFIHNGKRCSLGYASAFEMGIVKQCFEYCKQSSDNELKSKISKAQSLLQDFTATSTGINEWNGEKQIAEKGHRHFSPLYAFYPADQIKYYSTPKTFALAKQLLDHRISNTSHHIGWSAAWSIALFSRAHDRVNMEKVVDKMLSKSIFKNLFACHPPFIFQIDGNLGFVAGINEALFYEEDGIIDLLPACPSKWKNGSVQGHKINGATVDIVWENGLVTRIDSDKEISVNRINIANNVAANNVTFVEKR